MFPGGWDGCSLEQITCQLCTPWADGRRPLLWKGQSVTAKVWVGSQTISPNQWSSRVENVKLGIEIVQVSSEWDGVSGCRSAVFWGGPWWVSSPSEKPALVFMLLSCSNFFLYASFAFLTSIFTEWLMDLRESQSQCCLMFFLETTFYLMCFCVCVRTIHFLRVSGLLCLIFSITLRWCIFCWE